MYASQIVAPCEAATAQEVVGFILMCIGFAFESNVMVCTKEVAGLKKAEEPLKYI